MTKILVIEDDEHIRDEVMDWLTFEGYVVVGAANGRSGLDAALREAPDLILCDIAMPEMDGHDVLIAIRANPTLNDVPFLFLTAAADRAARRQGMDEGADDYLTKPFTHAEVLNAIQARLGKKARLDQQIQSQIEVLSQAFHEEQQKRLLKSRLVAMAAHDFRNVLSSILWSSEILMDEDNLLSPERKQRQFDRIRGSVHVLLQMLDDMLMVAEMDSGFVRYAPQPLDVTEFVETLVEEFRLIDQGVHRIILSNALVGPYEFDAKLLRQILANLISNAIKYSPPHTEILLQLTEVEGKVELAVRDQGIGIPAEDMPHLFEPFHRAGNALQVKGTGLGLAIVKECVTRHHGEIEVASVEGVGTTFTVRLPCLQTASEVAA